MRRSCRIIVLLSVELHSLYGGMGSPSGVGRHSGTVHASDCRGRHSGTVHASDCREITSVIIPPHPHPFRMLAVRDDRVHGALSVPTPGAFRCETLCRRPPSRHAVCFLPWGPLPAKTLASAHNVLRWFGPFLRTI